MKRSLGTISAIVTCWSLGLIFVSAQQVVVTRAYTVQSGDLEQVAAELRAALNDNATVTVDAERNQVLVAAEEYVHTELQRALSAGEATKKSPPTTAAPTSPPNPPSSPTPRNTETSHLSNDSGAGEPRRVAQLPAETPPTETLPGPVELPSLTPQREVAPQQPAGQLAAPTDGSSQQIVTLNHAAPLQVTRTIQRLLQNQSQTTTEGARSIISAVGRDGQPIQFVIDTVTGQVILRGNAATRAAWQRVLVAIDHPTNAANDRTQLISVTGRKPQAVQRALQLIRQQNEVGGTRVPPPRQQIVQWQQGRRLPPPAAVAQIAQNQPAVPAAPPAAEGQEQTKGLLGPVQIVYLEGLDVIVLRGNPQDVERVQAIIDEIESLSAVTEPAIEVYELKHANSQAMADLVNPLYEQVLSSRQGPVSITPLVQPNSILLVGRADSVRLVLELVEKLDQPTTPDTQFHVFRLKNMNAADALTTITSFYEERGGLGTRVRVTSDARSNSIILQAGPRDAEEVGKLIEDMDIEASSTEESMQVFKLRYSLAEELAPILQEALQGQQPAGGAAAPGGAGTGAQNARATALSLLTVDTQGERLVKSGILSNVTIVAETQTNSIIARGPEKTMPLIEALIKQLDELPSEDAEVKVFTLVHGDALLLTNVLNQLFGNQAAGGGAFGAGGGGFQGSQNQSGGEHPLIPLRFTVDERTNSIVATGSLQDLRVVEAILLRLDQDSVSTRRNIVYKLRYAPAVDVATAINQFLTSERSITQVAPNTVTPLSQIEREVIVVPEPVSNSLIVSATPRYFDKIYDVVQKIDQRPPMVMLQLLIAEVELDNITELGVELGLQDSLLFDRGVIDAVTGEVDPGFDFNNRPLGNVPVSPGTAAGQGITDFALNRVADQLGFGGLVLSVSSDSVSMLIRALEQQGRLRVLSRPQIMTLDNQTAFIQIGQRVPRITSVQLTQFGTINNTVLEDVGIVFGVTPRISPDGLVVMEIDAEKSKLGSLTSGIPIAISDGGDVIFSPIIDTKTAQATIAARNGQTVVFGGLIGESEESTVRRVPYLSDIPVLGELFKFDRLLRTRSELMFILTPHIVRGDQDMNCINQTETERMSWCLSDVYRIHGYFDVNDQGGLGVDGSLEMTEIYPDESPSAVDFPASGQPAGTYPTSESLYQPAYPNGPQFPESNPGGLSPNGEFRSPVFNGPTIDRATGIPTTPPSSLQENVPQRLPTGR